MEIIKHQTLYRDGEYVAFPNLDRLADGRVICAFRHAKERQKEYGRVTHVDPTAKDVFIVSNDGGKTFNNNMNIIVDDEMSDQDPCIKVLSDGRVIATYFRWELVGLDEGADKWGKERFEKYGRSLHDKHDCMSAGICYSISDDNCRTWRKMGVINPEGFMNGAGVRGNIVEMPDGELLLPFYGVKNYGEMSRTGLMRSDDSGETWYTFSEMAYDTTNTKHFLEPGLFLTEGGKLVGLFRTQSDFLKPGVDFEDTYLNLHIAVSEDGGKSFGPVKEIEGLWGSSPFHALKLASGNVIIAYGYRRTPFGIRAKICDAELENIADAPEIILRDDAINGDLGYPHCIQLDDETIMVSYYISGDDGIRKIEATLIKE